MITGPAGAGKSTAAAAWAARGKVPRAFIDADALRTNIRAGIAYPEHGWTDETQRQWDVAMDLWRSMARIYRDHGIDCVVDLYAPPCPDPPADVVRSELDILRIILLPELEVCLARNRKRGNHPLLSDDQLAANYSGFEGCVRAHHPDHVIDNGSMTTAQTVDAIELIIAGVWLNGT
jgi:gluconate kinase